MAVSAGAPYPDDDMGGGAPAFGGGGPPPPPPHGAALALQAGLEQSARIAEDARVNAIEAELAAHEAVLSEHLRRLVKKLRRQSLQHMLKAREEAQNLEALA